MEQLPTVPIHLTHEEILEVFDALGRAGTTIDADIARDVRAKLKNAERLANRRTAKATTKNY